MKVLILFALLGLAFYWGKTLVPAVKALIQKVKDRKTENNVNKNN